MEFSERLKLLRKEANETQPALAVAIGVSTKQIVRVERGEQKPGFDNLWKVADHFQVTMDFLAGREPPSGGGRYGPRARPTIEPASGGL